MQNRCIFRQCVHSKLPGEGKTQQRCARVHSVQFFNFLCELDLLGSGSGVVEVLIEEGVGIILDNVVNLTLGKYKTRVDGVRLISKVDPLINGNLP